MLLFIFATKWTVGILDFTIKAQSMPQSEKLQITFWLDVMDAQAL